MNELYKFETIFKINDEKSISYSSIWHYGELPETKVHNWSIDDLKEGVSGFFADNGFIFKKIWSFRLNGSFSTYREREIKTASTEIIPIKINYSYTISDLMSKLSAEDFIKWCKDNDIKEIFVQNT